jgi:hypothetical protein
MPSPELDRLVEAGLLHDEPPIAEEIDGLIRSATARLRDARNTQNSIDGRFDLAYNAAHALALAALRSHGYRAANRRFIVFQALPHTLDIPSSQWRVLSKCHDERNKTEYQGRVEIDETLLENLIQITGVLLEKMKSKRRFET